MTTKSERVAAALAEATARAQERYDKKLEHLDQLFAGKDWPLSEHHARLEAEQSFRLNLIRTRLAILEGRYTNDGCVPGDLVENAHETAYGQRATDAAVDE